MVRRSISMADVAREAQVSLMTVSRVVRNKEDVSPVTRQRVTEAIERLGYQPNSLARSLVTHRSGTLGLVMPDVANPFFSDIAHAVESVASAEGYNLFLCNTGEDPHREQEMISSLQEKRVDGIILCSSRMESRDLRALVDQYPGIVLTNRRLEGAGVGTVLVNHQKGGYDATLHLAQSNHVRIGFVAGPVISRGGREREAGYRAALDHAGINFVDKWKENCTSNIEGGYEATLKMLARSPELSALFCYNDLVAIGAMRAIKELGKRIPEDIAIVGFDDIPLAALVTPSLTTSHVARYEIGSNAAHLLLQQLNKEDDQYDEIVLEPELVIRQSAP
jgi:LacI family transcriptional regulator